MPVTAFLKQEKIAHGSVAEVAAVLRALAPPRRSSDLLAFDDESGRQVDIDLRPDAEAAPPRRGRPAMVLFLSLPTLARPHSRWPHQGEIHPG